VPRNQAIHGELPDSPVEGRATRPVVTKLHELEQLVMGDEARVQNLTQKREVVLDIQTYSN